ncbi:uncharacterized protein LOC116302790 [Actinia tenebrosa]|uniref:Uncharacterized protein LOC116302790 n=1 Tax=Actinia tenebrosa TaxID=6105 RepID=A0A6P8IMF3_ACTTE|nr:uncharacterized protein LOC116302790 [Actinia tenebrosa]
MAFQTFSSACIVRRLVIAIASVRKKTTCKVLVRNSTMSKHVLGCSGLTRSDQESFKRSDFYVQIFRRSREEANKQTTQLLEIAEVLCKEDSKNSQRKGNVFKKLAPQIEKHVFDGLQKDICVNLWEEAAEHVYGTTTN